MECYAIQQYRDKESGRVAKQREGGLEAGDKGADEGQCMAQHLHLHVFVLTFFEQNNSSID